MSIHKFVKLLILVSAAIIITGCGGKKEASNMEDGSVKKQVSFMYFGTIMEKKSVEEMIENFENKFPNIKVKPLYVTNSSYDAKMSTLIVSGNTPDIAYFNEQSTFEMAQAGKIYDLDTLSKDDPNYKSSDILDQCKYYLGDKFIASSTAGETIQLFYNKKLFDKAGIEYPPAEADKAWTWDKFLEVAKKLTLDRNGKHSGESGFDPDKIKQYGFSITPVWAYYLPFVWSNGGRLSSIDGKTPMFDQPEYIEVVQKFADLINKYHVAPNSAQKKTMPINIALMTGQVAMSVSGQWSILDLNKAKVDYGIGVLPKFKKPYTMILGAPTVVFKTTKHPKAAWELYKYHDSFEMSPMLFKNGLWMPIEKKYYTDENFMNKWIDNDAHPKEYKTAVVDYCLNNALPSPAYSLKNVSKISEEMKASLDNVWMGNESAENALKKLAVRIKPLFQGRYSTKNIPNVDVN